MLVLKVYFYDSSTQLYFGVTRIFRIDDDILCVFYEGYLNTAYLELNSIRRLELNYYSEDKL